MVTLSPKVPLICTVPASLDTACLKGSQFKAEDKKVRSAKPSHSIFPDMSPN